MTTTPTVPAPPTPPSVNHYPVRLDATLDVPLSRWLWLVKWLLVIPHYIVLVFLWMAFAVLTVVAFFAILFTGRYPRPIFDFNVGVLRWSWRVAYYAYGGLGTDRYPPFSMAEEPDYPAHLSIDYPERLSRGLVLVKWWLLALPHYLVVGFFLGGGAWFGSRGDDWQWTWGGGGLVGILVLVAAVVLAVTGGYPRALFDLVVGMNRWAFRVAGYATLMTDRYPPFRLDLGGDDPGSLASGGTRGTGGIGGIGGTTPDAGSRLTDRPSAPLGAPVTPSHTWSAGRVVTLVVGALTAFAAVGVLVAGVALTAADHVSRDSQGYLTSPSTRLATQGYAIVSDGVRLDAAGPDWALPSRVLGTARIRAVGTDPSRPVFLGIARTDQVDRYLATVDYATVTGIGNGRPEYLRHVGAAPATSPGQLDIWVARASGTGRQTLNWEPAAGDWTVVVMNADGSRSLSVEADAAATVPALTWIATGLAIGGGVLLVIGVLLVVVAVSSAAHGSGRSPAPGP